MQFVKYNSREEMIAAYRQAKLRKRVAGAKAA